MELTAMAGPWRKLRGCRFWVVSCRRNAATDNQEPATDNQPSGTTNEIPASPADPFRAGRVRCRPRPGAAAETFDATAAQAHRDPDSAGADPAAADFRRAQLGADGLHQRADPRLAQC